MRTAPHPPAKSARPQPRPAPTQDQDTPEPEPGHDPPRLERDPDSPLGKGEDVSLQPREESVEDAAAPAVPAANESVESAASPEDVSQTQHETAHGEQERMDRDPMEPQRDDFFPKPDEP